MAATATKMNKSKKKKKYNKLKRHKHTVRLVADLASELEQIVLQVAVKRGKKGIMTIGAIKAIADWWVKDQFKEDPARHHLRVAAREAFIKVITERARVEAEAAKKASKLARKA